MQPKFLQQLLEGKKHLEAQEEIIGVQRMVEEGDEVQIIAQQELREYKLYQEMLWMVICQITDKQQKATF